MFCGDTEPKHRKKQWRFPHSLTEIPKLKFRLIIASTLSFLVILAVPTLQGVVLMNRVPDPNDSETLEKLGLDRSAN